jgi:hypothetical protein
VGLFNFLQKRRRQESALTQAGAEAAPGSFANPEGQPVVGSQLADGGGYYNRQGPGLIASIGQSAELVPMLKQMQPMMEQQMKQAMAHPPDQAQIAQMQASGNALREEIFGIMKEHGVDPTGATAPTSANMESYAQMQQQIMEAVSRHGYNAGVPAWGQAPPPAEPGN